MGPGVGTVMRFHEVGDVGVSGRKRLMLGAGREMWRSRALGTVG